jgi:TRAP-type C4-dicarboxylate transport system permease small subunit
VGIPDAVPDPIRRAADLYATALHRLDRGARLAIVACTGAMVVVVTVQVALRYLLNTSIDWSDEVSRLLFVWCMFLAIPLGLREGAHVAVEILVQHFPDALRRQVARLCTLASIGLMAIVLWQTVIVARDTWDELMPTLGMSVNWFLVPVAVSAAHSILHLLQLLWREPARPGAAATE